MASAATLKGDPVERLSGSPQDEVDRKRSWEGRVPWGKRADDDTAARYIAEVLAAHIKRKWGNNMRTWGKRLSEAEVEAGRREWDDGSAGLEKRKWGNGMRVWGKRAEGGAGDDVAQKRAWDMRVWGKRSWKTNNMRVWGKRQADRWDTPDSGADSDDKRDWKYKSMRVWGKRSVDAAKVKAAERQ